jgi:hypothetical protein
MEDFDKIKPTSIISTWLKKVKESISRLKAILEFLRGWDV